MTPSYIEASVKNKEKLGQMLGVTIPEDWPSIPKAYTALWTMLKRNKLRLIQGWWFFFIVDHIAHDLVGSVGFGGFPDQKGEVELGYELTAKYFKKKPDGEILNSLIGYAFTRPDVNNVIVRTGPYVEGDRQDIYRGLKMTPDYLNKDIIRWAITREAFEA